MLAAFIVQMFFCKIGKIQIGIILSLIFTVKIFFVVYGCFHHVASVPKTVVFAAMSSVTGFLGCVSPVQKTNTLLALQLFKTIKLHLDSWIEVIVKEFLK